MFLFEDKEIKIAKEFFEKMGLASDIKELKKEKDSIFARLETEDSGLLIGRGGETLSEMQLILKMVLKKKTGQVIYVDIDVNGYKKEKVDSIAEMAKKYGDEVALTGKEKILPQMSSYERRIIHMTLKERPDVETESRGEGEERRIVIKPKI